MFAIQSHQNRKKNAHEQQDIDLQLAKYLINTSIDIQRLQKLTFCLQRFETDKAITKHDEVPCHKNT